MLGGPNYDTADDAPSGPSGGAGRTFIVLLLIAAGIWSVRKYGDYGAPAVAANDPRGGTKPILLMFTADWCGPCQAFKASVLRDSRVSAAINRSCRFEKVDLTSWKGQPAAVASRYGVDGVPTLILVNSRGHEIARYGGPDDPDAFARWLARYAR